MIQVKYGNAIPFYIVVENKQSDCIIKVDVINPLANEIVATVWPLPISGRPGHYLTLEYIMPDISNLIAVVYTYQADGVTLIGEDVVTITLANPDGAGQNFNDIMVEIDEDEEMMIEVDDGKIHVEIIEE